MTGLDEVEWKLISDLIESRFGLTFVGVRRDILEARLRPRLKDLHLHSFTEYYHYLRFHPEREAEFNRLACRITNNETYFFRETHHFDILVKHILPPLMPELRTRPLRILSAGCSSGEEPYTTVIALQNAGLEMAGVEWEIDACDLNPDRIARAREATYEHFSLRVCDEPTRQRYFREVGGRFVLKERHRKGVTFFESNLITPNGRLGWAVYDLILCRNLLIYVSDDAFDSMVNLFARSLMLGGYLFLGHSESLIDRGTSFVPLCLDGVIVYRKTVSGR